MLEPARLTVDPASLVLAQTWVGLPTRGTVTITNVGGTPVTSDVAIAAPFSTEPARVEVRRGESVAVTISFVGTAVGAAAATLRVGSLEVPVSAEVLEVPQCAAPVCGESQFSAEAGQCVSAPAIDGSACLTRCVAGACHAGVCEGRLVGCDDQNACTLDACDEATGCVHPPLVCPPPAVCRVVRCDSSRGCVDEEAPDGTLCGADDCEASQVDVCILGACVRRVRPADGRCSNRWVPNMLPGRENHASAYDEVRRRVVVFGGYSGSAHFDTWEWDGSRWTERTPARSPSSRFGHAMVWDPVRRRVVLFGGRSETALLGDTWEWDGTTWLLRSSTGPARASHALAWDVASQRVLLFGGDPGTGFAGSDETWAWNGVSWAQLTPAHQPGARLMHAMATDGARREVVLFGGFRGSSALRDQWTWNGVDWTQKSPSGLLLPVLMRHSLVSNALSGRLVLVGGDDGLGNKMSGLWEWNGSNWTHQVPSPAPSGGYGQSAAWDSVRDRLVVFGGSADSFSAETWEWTGLQWEDKTPTGPRLGRAHMAWDEARRVLVLVGGSPTQTWEWDGTRWASASPATAPAQGALAFDRGSQRLIAFDSDTQWAWDGGSWGASSVTPGPALLEEVAWDSTRRRLVTVNAADTWEADATGWQRRSTTNAPSSRVGFAIGFDSLHGRTVLFGGSATSTLADTWEWDGAGWVQRAPSHAPAARDYATMAFDERRQRLLLFGGRVGSFTQETWEWDGSDWSQRTPVTSPPATEHHPMAWDTVRGQVLLFDGRVLWRFLP